jgi:hypothetical protein
MERTVGRQQKNLKEMPDEWNGQLADNRKTSR